MTVAVVDRLVHYATIFEINIQGYRLPPLAAQSLNLALIDMNGSYVGVSMSTSPPASSFTVKSSPDSWGVGAFPPRRTLRETGSTLG